MKLLKRLAVKAELDPDRNYAADLLCLGCESPFHSEDRRSIRHCDRCRSQLNRATGTHDY